MGHEEGEVLLCLALHLRTRGTSLRACEPAGLCWAGAGLWELPVQVQQACRQLAQCRGFCACLPVVQPGVMPAGLGIAPCQRRRLTRSVMGALKLRSTLSTGRSGTCTQCRPAVSAGQLHATSPQQSSRCRQPGRCSTAQRRPCSGQASAGKRVQSRRGAAQQRGAAMWRWGQRAGRHLCEGEALAGLVQPQHCGCARLLAAALHVPRSWVSAM